MPQYYRKNNVDQRQGFENRALGTPKKAPAEGGVLSSMASMASDGLRGFGKGIARLSSSGFIPADIASRQQDEKAAGAINQARERFNQRNEALANGTAPDSLSQPDPEVVRQAQQREYAHQLGGMPLQQAAGVAQGRRDAKGIIAGRNSIDTNGDGIPDESVESKYGKYGIKTLDGLRGAQERYRRYYEKYRESSNPSTRAMSIDEFLAWEDKQRKSLPTWEPGSEVPTQRTTAKGTQYQTRPVNGQVTDASGPYSSGDYRMESGPPVLDLNQVEQDQLRRIQEERRPAYEQYREREKATAAGMTSEDRPVVTVDGNAVDTRLSNPSLQSSWLKDKGYEDGNRGGWKRLETDMAKAQSAYRSYRRGGGGESFSEWAKARIDPESDVFKQYVYTGAIKDGESSRIFKQENPFAETEAAGAQSRANSTKDKVASRAAALQAIESNRMRQQAARAEQAGRFQQMAQQQALMEQVAEGNPEASRVLQQQMIESGRDRRAADQMALSRMQHEGSLNQSQQSHLERMAALKAERDQQDKLYDLKVKQLDDQIAQNEFNREQTADERKQKRKELKLERDKLEAEKERQRRVEAIPFNEQVASLPDSTDEYYNNVLADELQAGGSRTKQGIQDAKEKALKKAQEYHDKTSQRLEREATARGYDFSEPPGWNPPDTPAIIPDTPESGQLKREADPIVIRDVLWPLVESVDNPGDLTVEDVAEAMAAKGYEMSPRIKKIIEEAGLRFFIDNYKGYGQNTGRYGWPE